MTKRKSSAVVKRKKTVAVKKQFGNAMKRLRRMKPIKQREAALTASNEFIRDISNFMSKIRTQPDLVNASQRKVLKKHSSKLKKLIHAKTPLQHKRLILSQTGGILPALIPIICAAIGATGGIAGAATSAAIIKS